MPNAPPPAVVLKFEGKRAWPLDPVVDDWGLTPDQQESYVEQFRKILVAKGKWKEDEHDFFTLRRFLRARTYDLERATAMFLNHLQWQEEWKTAGILVDFHFHERDAFLQAYPQGYHKVDKMGRPVYVQQLGKIDVGKLKKICTEERMIKFHIQEYERCRKVILPICSRLAGKHLDQTFGIMDVSGVGLGHLTGEVKRIMQLVTKYDQDNYPEMLGHICIINAPYIFKTLWGIVKGFIDPRTQSKIEILGTDYKAALLKWVDEDNLMVMHGGKSTGTLLDDIGPWSDADLLKRIGVDLDELKSGRTLAALPAQPSLSRTVSLTAAVHNQAFLRSGSATSDGFVSVTGSIDAGHKRYSGVSQSVADEVAYRVAASMTGASPSKSHNVSASGAAEAPVPCATLPEEGEQGATPGQTLRARILTLERSLAPYLEQQRQRHGGAHGDVGGGISLAGADASLLQRVQVLEEALVTLMEAQQVVLQSQQQELAQAPAPTPAAQPACCTIM